VAQEFFQNSKVRELVKLIQNQAYDSWTADIITLISNVGNISEAK
jgi:hypothetical protein